MNQIELIAVRTMKNYVLMIIEISAGTTMYRWMEYDILTGTMIIYDQRYTSIILLSWIGLSLRIPYYFYWYPLTISERYTIMIHLNKNQTTVGYNTNNWNDCSFICRIHHYVYIICTIDQPVKRTDMIVMCWMIMIVMCWMISLYHTMHYIIDDNLRVIWLL